MELFSAEEREKARKAAAVNQPQQNHYKDESDEQLTEDGIPELASENPQLAQFKADVPKARKSYSAPAQSQSSASLKEQIKKEILNEMKSESKSKTSDLADQAIHMFLEEKMMELVNNRQIVEHKLNSMSSEDKVNAFLKKYVSGGKKIKKQLKESREEYVQEKPREKPQHIDALANDDRRHLLELARGK